MTDFQRLLRVLLGGEVEFVLIGGVAAIVHGSARFTQDLDVIYSRLPENIERLASAVAPLNPYLRGAPPGLPFQFDAKTIARGLNFTLTTEAGDFDLLGEIPGGNYQTLLPFAETINVSGLDCPVLGLEKLIEVKRAAGRPKDLEAIAELEVLLEEKEYQ